MKTILYFTAEWCGPCKKTRPIVEELNKDLSLTNIRVVDIDSEMELAKNFGIKSVPTFIVIENNSQKYFLIFSEAIYENGTDL